MDVVRASVHAWCIAHVSWPLLHVRMLINFWSMYFILLKSVVHGHGQGKCLGMCLVLQPRASCVMSLWHVPMFQCAACERLKMLAVHGHGRGTCLCTCLVQQQCVSSAVAFAVCINADKYSVMFLISLHWLCMGMDETLALVHALCSNSVSSVP